MASHDNIIPEESFKQDTTQGIVELHLTGGVRAIEDGNRRWIWHPVLSGGTVQALEALPINRIDQHAGRVGLLLFGGDQQSGLEGSLVSRSWTPLNGAHDPNSAAALRRAAKGNGAAVEAVKGNAERFAADLKGTVGEIMASGKTSLPAIAAELNDRHIRTRRGGRWHASSVRNILARL